MSSATYLSILCALSVLLVAVRSQGCAGKLDGQLLVSEKNKIWRVSRDGEERSILLNDSVNAHDMEYDVTQDVLYWCESQLREVHSLMSGESKHRLAVPRQRNWLPVALAIDPIAHKLYVAEGFSDTVQMFQPGSKHGPVVVVGSNASELKDIVIDPYKGYLFVLDRYQIFRTDLDGENYKPLYMETGSVYDIVSELPSLFRNILDYGIQRGVNAAAQENKLYKKALSVADIALDLDERRLYWVNTARQRVESSDYEGKDRKSHFEDKSVTRLEDSSVLISLVDDSLFWANDVNEKIIRADTNNGSRHELIMSNVKAQSIKGVSCTAHRFITDPCVNSSCEQICVRSRISKTKYRCACNFGFELAEDGRSCSPLHDFLFYIQNQYLRGRLLNTSINGLVNGVGLVDVMNPTRYELGSRVVIDYDAEDGLLYYTGLYPKNRLHRIHLISGEETVLSLDLLGKDVDQFAYDWTTRNLYYFGHYYADTTTLSVSSAVNATKSKLLLEDVHGLVRALVLHPGRGYLFFGLLFEDEGRANIKRLGMDGSDLKTLVAANHLDSLDGLAIDYDEERIYWSQSQRTVNGVWRVRIRHANLDGGDIKDLTLPESLGRPDCLAVHGDSLYAIVSSEMLIKLDKRTGTGLTSLATTETPGLLGGLRLFSRTIQDKIGRSCNDLECDKLCLIAPSDNGTTAPVCACPYGEKLADDGKSCEDNQEEEPAFLPCDFESFKCSKRKMKVKKT